MRVCNKGQWTIDGCLLFNINCQHMRDRLLAIEPQPGCDRLLYRISIINIYALKCQPSIVNCQLSICLLSTVNCQSVCCQLSIINYQLSTIDYQSIASGDARTTTLNSQLSTFNFQLSTLKIMSESNLSPTKLLPPDENLEKLLWLFGFRIDPEIEEPNLYTLIAYGDRELPLVAGGQLVFFTRPELAINALELCGINVSELGTPPTEIDAICDLAETLYLLDAEDVDES
ncbi:MAG: hypothetical protein ACRC62_31175, partial [Microcoleus sp.]